MLYFYGIWVTDIFVSRYGFPIKYGSIFRNEKCLGFDNVVLQFHVKILLFFCFLRLKTASGYYLSQKFHNFFMGLLTLKGLFVYRRDDEHIQTD